MKTKQQRGRLDDAILSNQFACLSAAYHSRSKLFHSFEPKGVRHPLFGPPESLAGVFIISKTVTMTSPETSSSTFRIAATALAIGTASLLAYKASKKSPPEEETWETHCTGHGELQEVWPDTLYTLEAKGCSRGPPTRNMAIYKVPDGSKRLVIYNGIAVKEETVEQIEALGTPSVLVIPNYYHRCCAAVWKERYPNIMVVCPQVARENAEKVVKVDATIEEWAAMPEWRNWVHATTIDGWGPFESVVEVDLEKKANGKKAVLVCDLLFTVPYEENAGYADRFAVWMFDSSIELPPDGEIVIPKVARISRIFAIEDWAKAEQWYRIYAREHGKNVAAILVGHGVAVKEVDSDLGCTEAFIGVANQLSKPRW